MDAGQDYSVDFPIRQQAGTYWYHAHTDRLTGKQVYLGLAGFFIVEDPAERHLGLPHGDHDLPLLFQDRRTHGETHLAYEPEEMDIATGFLGDAVFVNNTPEPWPCLLSKQAPPPTLVAAMSSSWEGGSVNHARSRGRDQD